MDKIGAAVWATGRAGRVIVEAGLTRPWLAFRGGIVYNPAKEGLDLGEACGLDVRVGAPVSHRRRCRPGPARHRRRVLRGHRDAGRGRRRVPAGEPRGQGRDHDLRARPSARRSWARTRPHELDAALARGRPADPRHRVLGLPDDHACRWPRSRTCSTFDEIRLERIADTDAVGPRDPARRGHRRAARGRRRRVHDAQLPGRGADAARRIVRGSDIDEPVFESVPVLSDVRRERAGLRRRARDDLRPRPPGQRRTCAAAGDWCRSGAAGSISTRSVTGWKRSARVVVDGDPRVRDDRPGRPVPRHVSADRRPGDGRCPSAAWRSRPGCTRSTSWASGRSSARDAGTPPLPRISRCFDP